METNIPENNHPLLSFAKLTHHFARFKEYKYDILSNVQVMIILTKLPRYMDVIAQLLNMCPKEDEIAPLSLQKIEDAALMAWQQHVTKQKLQQPQQANKVTAVKQKGQDPQFQQQLVPCLINRARRRKGRVTGKTVPRLARRSRKSGTRGNMPMRYPLPPLPSTPPLSSLLLCRPRIKPLSIPACCLTALVLPHMGNLLSLTPRTRSSSLTVWALCPPSKQFILSILWLTATFIGLVVCIPTNKRPHLKEHLDKDPSETTSPSHSHTNTFGGEPLPSPPSSNKNAYPHSWDENNEEVVDINGSETGFNIDDYYINADVFDEDQFLGMAEEFGFEMDIWSVPPCPHFLDTDAQSFSPQNNIIYIYTCSSVVDSDMDTNRPTFLHSHCHDCIKPTRKGKEHAHDHQLPPDM